MQRLPIAILAGVLAATPALAATRHEHHFKLAFSSQKPGAATGINFRTDRFAYKAPAQGQAADRVATTTFVMAPGTRTNLAAYPKCTQAALEAKGPMGCPARSNVGSGSAAVITGLPIDPVVLDAKIFVKKGGLLAYLTGSGQTQVIAMSMAGNKIVAAVPRKCLVAGDCTKGEAVLKVLTVKLNPGKLVTTPRSCPSSHKWTNTVLYKYVNGDTEKQTSTSPCKG